MERESDIFKKNIFFSINSCKYHFFFVSLHSRSSNVQPNGVFGASERIKLFNQQYLFLLC